MKLLNQSIKYLFVPLLLIIGLWAMVFYFNMLNEIKESIDEGLENYKRQIVWRARTDSTLFIGKTSLDEMFFTIREITYLEALGARDVYMDSLMYMQDSDDEEPELEPVRVLTTAFESDGRFYELKIINSMVEEDDLIEELLWEAVYLYLILVVCIILINNMVLQRLWTPFYHLLHQFKSYRLGSSEKLPEIKTKTKEFNDLQNAVRTLLLHSVETFEQQKQFIGNASHELQTPLAIAVGKLELLLEKSDPDASHTEDIVQILQIVERLIRLNKSLLLLTKIENKQFGDNQMIVVNQVVARGVEELEDIARFREVEISITEHSELKAYMDPSLANIVIGNLIKNAIFHNTAKGTVRIEISGLSVKICNSGTVEPLDREKIFTRFYKSGSKTAGTGLGLAIVKAICVMYGFTITYSYGDNGHCFTLHFSA